MISILDDMWKHASIDTPYGKIISINIETNGEMLQALSRIYWMIGNEKYLEWAIRLGNYYLLGNHHPTRDSTLLKLRDQGKHRSQKILNAQILLGCNEEEFQAARSKNEEISPVLKISKKK